MSYRIDPIEPSEQFLRARNTAGCVLQEQFTINGGKLPEQVDFKWIKAELTWPSFDHLTFSYGNQVFAVLVDLVDGPRSSLTPHEVERCENECLENHLVPCVFQVDSTTLQPRSKGWNLLHLQDRGFVDPLQLADDSRVEMSEWEIRNFCIQIVRKHIEGNMSATVLSFCDVVAIDPQVWFEDDAGTRNWVIVRNYPSIQGDEAKTWIGFEKSNPQLASFDGYLAAVSLASSEPLLLGKDGRIIPLSERFSGKEPLYRGDGFYIKFEGLQRIYVC